MASDVVADLFHLLNTRYDLLQCIADGTLDKQVVDAEVDASRPTIDRAYRELEDAGILTSTGTTYELTTFGALFCREFIRTDETLGTLSEIRHVLSELPRDAGIEMRLLDGADIRHAENHGPLEPFIDLVESARNSNEITGYSMVLRPYYLQAFHSLIIDEGITMTLVLTDDIVETVFEKHTDIAEEILAADHATIYETSILEPYGVMMTDESVAVPIAEQRVGMQAVIVNDTDAAVEWATDFFDRLTGAAETNEL